MGFPSFPKFSMSFMVLRQLRHQLVAEDLRSLIETTNTPIFGLDAKGCALKSVVQRSQQGMTLVSWMFLGCLHISWPLISKASLGVTK